MAGGRGYPIPGLGRGVPHPRSQGTPSQRGVTPSQGWEYPIPGVEWVPNLRSGWKVPHPVLDGGTPGYPLILDGVSPISRMGLPTSQTWDGVPLSGPGMGNPCQQNGVPPVQTWDGYLHPWDGVPPTQTWDGVPPPDLGRGTPPPRKCGQTETNTFPHPSDAGGENRRR